jgi:hypothetical protein
MPLLKRTPEPQGIPPTPETTVQGTTPRPEATAQGVTPKPEATAQARAGNSELGAQTAPQSHRLGGMRKAGDKAMAPLSKEGYWERKELRDIETGIRIRRSGVWQAALQSMGLLQLNTGNTLEEFLSLVEKAADIGLKYVNKE